MKRNVRPTLPRNAVDLPVRLFTLSTIELDLLYLTQWNKLAVEARVQSLTRHVLFVVDKVTLEQKFGLSGAIQPQLLIHFFIRH